jgi:hypothetical protein
MKSRSFPLVLVVLVAALAGACRQPDGPLPAAEGDAPNRVGDLSRDILSVARGETTARQDFADDLRVFVEEKPEAIEAVDELARRTSESISGTEMSDQNAQQLAHHLWTAVAARELSERQVESLQNDLQSMLVSAGIPEATAQNVATQAGEVQRTVTDRRRRWYEFF